MDDIHAFRLRQKRALKTGLTLLGFCAPLLFISAVKSSSSEQWIIVGNLADSLYQNWGWFWTISNWPIFPVFSLRNGFGFADSVVVGTLLGVVWGYCSVNEAWRMHLRYWRLKGEASDEHLRRQF
jgi:hypothetical protein